MTRAPAAASAAIALLLAGCGVDSGASAPPPPFDGTWRGTAQDNVAGPGSFEATLAHTGPGSARIERGPSRGYTGEHLQLQLHAAPARQGHFRREVSPGVTRRPHRLRTRREGPIAR
jgi:hypothetical protein